MCGRVWEQEEENVRGLYAGSLRANNKLNHFVIELGIATAVITWTGMQRNTFEDQV